MSVCLFFRRRCNMRVCKTKKSTEIRSKEMSEIKDYLNKIICGDTVEVMKKLPDDSVDLVITSPPYNLKNSTGNGMKAGTKTGRWANNPLQNGYTLHNDEMPHEEYVAWQRDVLTECM